MTTYGLLSTGFVPAPADAIRADLEAAVRAVLGDIPLGDGTVLGILIGVIAERLALLWELAEQVNASQDPDGATGTSLIALCALTGIVPQPATHSTDTLTLTGANATVVAVGSRAASLATGALFETLADATIVALDAWTNTTGYAVGDRATNGGSAYACITAGTSAGSGGPLTTSSDITDGTVHWRYLGAGAGAVDVDARAVETGPVEAVSGDVSVINTPVGGWTGVINLLDAEPGRDDETDAELRQRRERALATAGTSTADAIRADLLAVALVTAVTVFVNDTEVTDGDGVPAHSVECLVQGGDDQDVADQVFGSVAAGIGTHGTTSATVTDSEGVDHTVEFSRPTERDIWVDVTLVKDPATYPSDGDAQVAAAIAAYGNSLGVGVDSVATRLGARAFAVTGVLDVPRSGSLGGTLIKTSAGPTADTTIAMSTRQIAVYDTSRITIHSSDGTP